MVMRKRVDARGQLFGMPFVVIFSLIVMALILLFGARSIRDLGGVADMTELSRFVGNLQNVVEVYYNYDVGSKNEVSLNVPGKIEKICFFNPGGSINVGVDMEFRERLEDNSRDNMWILPLDAFKSPAPDFRIEYLRAGVGGENPLCILTKESCVLFWRLRAA